jgi:hypothetical protein
MTPFTDIPLALIAAYRAGAFFPDALTAWPNTQFTKPADGVTPWANITHLPNQPEALAYDTNDHTGIMQIDVMYAGNTGTGYGSSKVDAIGAYFRAGRRFDYNGQIVQIISLGVSGGLDDMGWWMVPVTVTYRAFAAR